MALWPTATAGNHNFTEAPETWRARQAKLKARGINGNGAGPPLGIVVKEAALWATARDHRSGRSNKHGDNARPLNEQAVRHGQENGESAQTASSGYLAPEFAWWLMGLPADWLLHSSSLATPSFRSSRRRSSKRAQPKSS